MKFRIEKSELNRALSVINSSMSGISENSVKIVKYVKLKGDGDKIHLTATNKSIAVFMTVDAECDDEFEECLPHKQLNSLVKLLNETIEVKGHNGRAIITQNKSRLQIPISSASDFPTNEVLVGQDASISCRVRVTIPELIKSIQTSSLTIGRVNQSSWILTCLNLAPKNDSLNFYACDGHQISRTILKNTKSDGDIKNTPSALLPALVIPGLISFLRASKDGEVTIQFKGNKLAFGTHLGLFITVLGTGQFPDVEKVIQGESEHVFEVNRDNIENALQKALFFSQENGYCEIRLEQHKLTIQSRDTNLGESIEELDINCPTLTNNSVDFAVNGKQLLNAISEADELITLRVSEDISKPLFMETNEGDVNFKYLAMQMIKQ